MIPSADRLSVMGQQAMPRGRSSVWEDSKQWLWRCSPPGFLSLCFCACHSSLGVCVLLPTLMAVETMKIKCLCSLPLCSAPSHSCPAEGMLVPAAVPLFASAVHTCSTARSSCQWPRHFSRCKEMKPGSARGQGLIP